VSENVRSRIPSAGETWGLFTQHIPQPVFDTSGGASVSSIDDDRATTSRVPIHRPRARSRRTRRRTLDASSPGDERIAPLVHERRAGRVFRRGSHERPPAGALGAAARAPRSSRPISISNRARAGLSRSASHHHPGGPREVFR